MDDEDEDAEAGENAAPTLGPNALRLLSYMNDQKPGHLKSQINSAVTYQENRSRGAGEAQP